MLGAHTHTYTHIHTHTCLFFKPNFLVTFVKTSRNVLIIHIMIIQFDWFAKNFVRSDFKTFLGQF